MNERVKKFLQSLGVTPSVIDELAKDEATEGFDMDSTIQGFKTAQVEVLKNDPEIIGNLKNTIKGEELSKIEHKLKKQFGLSAEDVKDKKFDEIVEIAYQKMKSSTTETSQQLQDELIELRNQIKDYKEVQLPAAEKAAQEKIDSYEKNNLISGIIQEFELVVNPKAIMPAVAAYVNANYVTELDADRGSLVVKTKDGLEPLNADKTAKMTAKDVISGYLNELNVVKKSNGKDNENEEGKKPEQRKVEPNKTTPSTGVQLPGMKAAKANEEELGKMQTIGAGK